METHDRTLTTKDVTHTNLNEVLAAGRSKELNSRVLHTSSSYAVVFYLKIDDVFGQRPSSDHT